MVGDRRDPRKSYSRWKSDEVDFANPNEVAEANGALIMEFADESLSSKTSFFPKGPLYPGIFDETTPAKKFPLTILSWYKTDNNTEIGDQTSGDEFEMQPHIKMVCSFQMIIQPCRVEIGTLLLWDSLCEWAS